MASLHSALHSLAPCDFSDIPTTPDDLDKYLAELCSQSQLIVESVPIAAPDESQNGSHLRSSSNGKHGHASSSSEMSSSTARSPSPAPEHAALQKEWGKPIKLSAKDNPLGISVYKLGGKDGRGAWFGRRSVHEGLGFARFKRGFEKEFPTSLAVQGNPGEGNIRGIGADERVEDITVPHRGKLEVYRLSAQFPGPTTPRDFVTLLATSSKALKEDLASSKVPELNPRHYMVISKPCNHPQTQPRDNFIRGQYESVEFIRELPRKLKTSTSSTNLKHLAHKHEDSSLGRDLLIRNTEKKDHSGDLLHLSHSLEDDEHAAHDDSASTVRRKRSVTVSAADSYTKAHDGSEDYNPELNPVEWIMITRSDPGGSVPRFMVERGTPSSICADAQKFLDWACQQEEPDSHKDVPGKPSVPEHKKSFASWEANGHLAGIIDQKSANNEASEEPAPVEKEPELEPVSSVETGTEVTPRSNSTPGLITAVAGTIGAFAPQTVLDRLGLHSAKEVSNAIHQADPEHQDTLSLEQKTTEDDAVSIYSSTSFASADSHFESEDEPSLSSKSSPEKLENAQVNHHDKELAKLSQRKVALEAKMKSTREKLSQDNDKDNTKEQSALKKAEEKHEKELKKHEEKYKKEVAKIEHKKRKEAHKAHEKQKKQVDKDEKAKLIRERDEAKAQLDIYKKEREIWERQVGDLQRENTALAAKIGRLEGGGNVTGQNVSEDDKSTHGRLRGLTVGSSEGRNRSSSLLGKKNKQISSEA